MLILPTRSPNWRRSSLGNTFLPGELCTLVGNTDQPSLSSPLTPSVCVDLKGAPPLLTFLKSLLPLLGRSGATHLLVEYEDMFPHWGPLTNISATNAYTVQQVAEFLQAARENSLTVIPLVQTFGHLEWILKLERYKDLREELPYPQSICPSREGSLELVRLVLSQIMEVHRDSTHLHIGCDEVFQLGQCRQCLQRINRDNYNYRSHHHHHHHVIVTNVM